MEVTFKSIPSCSDTPDRVPQNDEENYHEALTLNSNLAEHFPKWLPAAITTAIFTNTEKL